ncbi:hypothetical protein EYF80_062072 [Liparis tanakae]|uniref:Secreted protein n=1 Tax=Liparis tanakae TaxID=230148 RepID=A0A4Z2EHI6_9TELE|nr:hypothetical protein EYF80_062072 [Liparis tanakae]
MTPRIPVHRSSWPLTWWCVSWRFWIRTMTGASISTSRLSLHERPAIRPSTPSVPTEVRSSTLTFRHTARPTRGVSLESLEVVRTCLCGLKEADVLSGQSLKQLDFHSACEGADGTHQDPPSAAGPQGAVTQV